MRFPLKRISCHENSDDYIKTLKSSLLPYIRGKDLRFMQDNVAIHNSYKTIIFLEDEGIYLIDWSTHSPDLNPIENLWNIINNIINKLRGGKIFATKDEYWEAIKEVWDSIP
jgi:transposase